MTDKPSPLIPSNVDLRDFQFMPLDVVRFRDSDFTALSTGEAFRAGIILWSIAWHQVPAGSLPSDNNILASLAGYARAPKEWDKLKDQALRGWIECSDGRLYHPVICEKAMEGWRSKQEHQYTKFSDRMRKANKKRTQNKMEAIGIPAIEQWISAGCPKDWSGNSASVPLEKTQDSGNFPAENNTNSGGNPTEKQSDSGGILSNSELKGQGQGIYINISGNSGGTGSNDQPDLPDWSPSLDALNTKLRMAGGRAVDEITLNQTLVLFNPHYEGQYMSPNKRLAKLVAWIRNNQQREVIAPKQTGLGHQVVQGQYNPDDDIPECLRDGYQPPPKPNVDQALQQRIKAEQRALADKLAAEVQAKKDREAAQHAGTP